MARSFARNYITGPEQFGLEDGSITVAIYDDCVSPSDRGPFKLIGVIPTSNTPLCATTTLLHRRPGRDEYCFRFFRDHSHEINCYQNIYMNWHIMLL